MNSLVYGLKASTKLALRDDYMYNLQTKFIVDTFFKQYITRRRHFTTITAVPVADIADLVKKAGPRTSVLAEFLYISGARISEALAIKKIDMRPVETAAVEIGIMGKGGHFRRIIMPDELIRKVEWVCRSREYLFENRNGERYNRREVYMMITGASTRILGYKINPHLLRHSFAQHTLEAAPSQINAIMKHLGHRSADTFIKTYINQSLSVQHLPKLRTEKDWKHVPAT